MDQTAPAHRQGWRPSPLALIVAVATASLGPCLIAPMVILGLRPRPDV